ncbi:DgyrCDS2103 [Dimorphilus gyrociliatus]|uniref:DgyrCDS2103 n=1 Tax=Dimorphilus gyrociliatus TaxID=2664684 RepID=A0A7I8VB30_9ANNE|nr:DgyrCDS2103 [Dimorphilus gyrociliatus]
MTSLRNPYPYPSYENDNDFAGLRSYKKEAYTQPTHLDQKQDPWNRLNCSGTLSSTRREVYNYDPKAPRDSLDFVLKADYDHHREWLKGKNETLFQPETLGQQNGRVLKNRVVEQPPAALDLNHPLKSASAEFKESPNSIKCAIEGHHSQATKRGYNRKPDGGFYIK